MIQAASLRPAEGERRVFVIEEAEALRTRDQNALLKTLEEPAPFAHLILICSEPELLAGTISRCREVEFAPLPPDAVLEALGESGAEAEAAARLSGGDLRLARLLLGEHGRALRSSATSAARRPSPRARAGRPSPGAGCWRPPRRPAGTPLPRRSGGCWRRGPAPAARTLGGQSSAAITRTR